MQMVNLKGDFYLKYDNIVWMILFTLNYKYKGTDILYSKSDYNIIIKTEMEIVQQSGIIVWKETRKIHEI